MKKFSPIIVALVVALAITLTGGCGGTGDPGAPCYVSFDTSADLRAYLAWSPDRMPLIGAHRGGPLPGFPENCLATFENSLAHAPCLIECDVQLTRDSVLIMMHDSTLDRTTTGSGDVREHTWEELRELKLLDNDGHATPYTIPTLREALEWARGKAILELDIKRPVTPEEIVAIIAEHRAESFTVVITYNTPSAAHYHQLNPELVISASAGDLTGAERLIASGINPENIIAFIGVSEPERPLYDYLHSHGVRAILGTMGNLDRRAEKRGHVIYRELIQNGADILATDNVPLAAEAIAELRR